MQLDREVNFQRVLVSVVKVHHSHLLLQNHPTYLTLSPVSLRICCNHIAYHVSAGFLSDVTYIYMCQRNVWQNSFPLLPLKRQMNYDTAAALFLSHIWNHSSAQSHYIVVGGGQRQKNPVGVSALPTGEFLRVRKVFVHV